MTNAYATDSQGEFVVLNRPQIEKDHARIATVSSSRTTRDALRLATIYRDPQDVRTVIHLARTGQYPRQAAPGKLARDLDRPGHHRRFQRPLHHQVLGRQDIHRLDNGATVDDPQQLSLSLKLIADPKGRADRNLRSGFLISSFDYKEIQ
jgi:hypothetical protein